VQAEFETVESVVSPPLPPSFVLGDRLMEEDSIGMLFSFFFFPQARGGNRRRKPCIQAGPSTAGSLTFLSPSFSSRGGPRHLEKKW